MKKIIEWVKSSNHYYHIGLLAALSLVMMSVGTFEFGASSLWTTVWQTVKFGIMTGLVIEAYQAITSKSIDWRNSLGDLLADAIGLVLGVGVYALLAQFTPLSAIILFCLSALCLISSVISTIEMKWRVVLLGGFVIGLLTTFSLFIYA